MHIIKRLRTASKRTRILLGGLLALILAVGVYYIPPVHDRLAWRIDSLQTRITYFFNPPDEAVFQPTEQAMLETIVAQTMQAYQPTSTPQKTATPRPGPSVTPTVTLTPLPDLVQLEGVKYEHQHGRNNYCGPANFSMALTFWGWDGNRDVIGRAVMPGNTTSEGKPADKDKNVMPYELQNYIAEKVPTMSSVIRYGGDIDLLRRMVSAGFPVVVEKGIYELDMNGKMGWMGHYAFVTGYDDAKQEIIYQDTYQPQGAPPGHDRRISFEEFIEGWRAFNYVFVVVYPYDREAQVLSLLGDWADNTWSIQHALDIAENESRTLTGIDQYFAWFNKGTSYISFTNPDYSNAALAYDYAFGLYAKLTGDDSIRPYRMMWYQTGPYKAYFFSGRYADVINLATTTLEDTISKPNLEESLYWRAQAEYMSGNTQAAVDDYRAALVIHPGWETAIQALQDLGIVP
ncbi:MAG: C39 family peptidase [Chloroflexota bacterium]